MRCRKIHAIFARGCAAGIFTKRQSASAVTKLRWDITFDDVIETILMGMLYGAQMQSMPPKLWSTNHRGMQLIARCITYMKRDIIRWKTAAGLEFLRCACKFTENCAVNEEDSKRLQVKRLIARLKEENENVDINIFRSAYNVHVDTSSSTIRRESATIFFPRYREKGHEF